MTNILILLGSASVFQLLAIALQRRHYTYLNRPALFTWIYATGGIALIALNPYTLAGPALQAPLLLAVLWLALVAGTLLVNAWFPIPTSYHARHPRSYFLDFNLTFVTVKIADILFQQIFLLQFVTALYILVPNMQNLMLLTIGVFALAHVPLVLLQRKVSVLHLLGAAICVGIVPWLNLEVKGGFWYLIIGHWLFYIIMRMALGIPCIRHSVLGQDITLET